MDYIYLFWIIILVILIILFIQVRKMKTEVDEMLARNKSTIDTTTHTGNRK